MNKKELKELIDRKVIDRECTPSYDIYCHACNEHVGCKDYDDFVCEECEEPLENIGIYICCGIHGHFCSEKCLNEYWEKENESKE